MWAFVGEHAPSLAPRHAENRTVNTCLGAYMPTWILDVAARRPRHVLDAQVLDHHETVLPGKVRGFLVQPVLAPTGLTGSQSADLIADLAFTARHRSAGHAGGALSSSLEFQLPQPTQFPVTQQRRHVEFLAI